LDFTIRYTQPEDLPALLDIYNYEAANGTATFDMSAKSAEDWQKWYLDHKSGSHFALTAVSGGRAVGYATLSEYREKDAYAGTVELSVYVNREFRRRGIAAALIREIVSDAHRRGNIHTIISVITGGNEASCHLHEKLGFTYCGTIRQVGLKFGQYLDITNWQLILK
jgi:L-amino acid N-acyltransferase